MAEVRRLKPFDDLSLVGRYAERFGLDPDHVFSNTSFNTIIGFAHMWKEVDEYHERYSFIYNELTKPDKK